MEIIIAQGSSRGQFLCVCAKGVYKNFVIKPGVVYVGFGVQKVGKGHKGTADCVKKPING